MDKHPVLGRTLWLDGSLRRVYTRTVVLWAVNLAIDPGLLWDHVVVEEGPPRGTRRRTQRPVVRMMTTATKRRGNLLKRLRAAQTFRSVLSMDVEYGPAMPNLKISARNTLQVTGAQDMEALGAILRFLCTEYAGRGVAVTGPDPGFVGDVVLANVHFRLNFRVDRAKLRDEINADRGPFLASYEPLVRDVSVSLKHADASDPPHDGAVFPRWFLASGASGASGASSASGASGASGAGQWTTVTVAEARRLVPHVNLKVVGPRVSSLRVFQSGSVIIVSRWPAEMQAVYARFQEQVQRLRPRVTDREYARQRLLTDCWRR